MANKDAAGKVPINTKRSKTTKGTQKRRGKEIEHRVILKYRDKED